MIGNPKNKLFSILPKYEEYFSRPEGQDEGLNSLVIRRYYLKPIITPTFHKVSR